MDSNKTYKFVINGTSVPCIKAESDQEYVIKCLSELSEDKTVDIDRIKHDDQLCMIKGNK